MGELSGASVLSRETWIVRPRPKSAESLLPGTVLGPYQLSRALGQGAAGLVYEATHTKLGRRVALKLLRQELCESRIAVSRFFAEAQMVNAIRHENIVQITDLVDADPEAKTPAYYVMDLLEGQTLHELMAQGLLPMQYSLRILEQVASALAAAHEAGIVHRDIKPANIFVTHDGTVKLLDFGIARLSTEAGLSKVETKAGNIVGTPGYMAPEQSMTSNVDPRADVYALGVVLFELATGRSPFEEEDLRDLILKHREETPPHPNDVARGPRVPQNVVALIQRCMAKSPAQRPDDAAEVQAALWGMLKRPAPVGFIAAAVLLLCVIAATSFALLKPQTPVQIPVAATTPEPVPAPKQPILQVAPVVVETDVKIAVASEPAGAFVIIDGKEAGKTPLSTTWPTGEGTRTVEVSRSGFTSVRKEVMADANQDISVVLLEERGKMRRPQSTKRRATKTSKRTAKRPVKEPKSVSPTRILNPFD